MAFMCAACSEVYDSYFTKCPKVHCNGLAEDDAVIYVEDVFAPVISMLNKKGYEVKGCYFGNPNNNITGQPYIILQDFLYKECGADELEEIFKNLPKPWKLNKNKQGCPVISCCIMDGRDKMLHLYKLLYAHIDLASFVENMPDLW